MLIYIIIRIHCFKTLIIETGTRNPETTDCVRVCVHVYFCSLVFRQYLHCGYCMLRLRGIPCSWVDMEQWSWYMLALCCCCNPDVGESLQVQVCAWGDSTFQCWTLIVAVGDMAKWSCWAAPVMHANVNQYQPVSTGINWYQLVSTGINWYQLVSACTVVGWTVGA